MAYVSDSFFKHPHAKPISENARAAEEGADPAFHNDNLFDQDEGTGGRLYDEATGRRIDNSTYTGLESLGVVAVGAIPQSRDILGRLPILENDKLADEWMRQHGHSWGE